MDSVTGHIILGTSPKSLVTHTGSVCPWSYLPLVVVGGCYYWNSTQTLQYIFDPITGYQTIDSLYPRSNTFYVDPSATHNSGLQALKSMNAYNASTKDDSNIGRMSATKGPVALSVQEQAGINTTFPGRTEYMHKYQSPPMDIPTSDFNINPKPNFLLHGRPLGETTYERHSTEYQTRYEFPDSNKIVRMPWLRKWFLCGFFMCWTFFSESLSKFSICRDIYFFNELIA